MPKFSAASSQHPDSVRRRLTVTLSVVACVMAASLLASAVIGAAGASATPRGAKPTHTQKPRHRRPLRRVGGPVHRAWPRTGKPPRTRLARWLARQVGSTKPRACAKHHKCRPRGKRRHAVDGQLRTPAAAMNISAGDPGSPSGGLARIAAGVTPSAQHATIASASTGALPLQLVRSYQIPADDPFYQRLLDWSWSYDSAVSAAAFASVGSRGELGATARSACCSAKHQRIDRYRL